MLFGRLGERPRVARRRSSGSGEAEVADLAGPLAAARAAALLVFARWVLVVTTFEHGLYADPEGDHDERWWELVRRFQLVTPPDGRAAPDWAAKIHLAVAPVYYQSYLYGEMVASQLGAALKEHAAASSTGPPAGRFLAERVFRPARRSAGTGSSSRPRASRSPPGSSPEDLA